MIAPADILPTSSWPVVAPADILPASSYPMIAPADILPASSCPVVAPADILPAPSCPVVASADILPTPSYPMIAPADILPTSSYPMIAPADILPTPSWPMVAPADILPTPTGWDVLASDGYGGWAGCLSPLSRKQLDPTEDPIPAIHDDILRDEQQEHDPREALELLVVFGIDLAFLLGLLHLVDLFLQRVQG